MLFPNSNVSNTDFREKTKPILPAFIPSRSEPNDSDSFIEPEPKS